MSAELVSASIDVASLSDAAVDGSVSYAVLVCVSSELVIGSGEGVLFAVSAESVLLGVANSTDTVLVTGTAPGALLDGAAASEDSGAAVEGEESAGDVGSVDVVGESEDAGDASAADDVGSGVLLVGLANGADVEIPDVPVLEPEELPGSGEAVAPSVSVSSKGLSISLLLTCLYRSVRGKCSYS